jgi:hypothetical protein
LKFASARHCKRVKSLSGNRRFRPAVVNDPGKLNGFKRRPAFGIHHTHTFTSDPGFRSPVAAVADQLSLQPGKEHCVSRLAD